LPKARRKNIKIAHKSIFSFEFFAPFNFLFLEEKNKSQCLQNKRLASKMHPESSSRLSDELFLKIYRTLFSFFSAIPSTRDI